MQLNRFVLLKERIFKRPLLIAAISAAAAVCFASGYLKRKEGELLHIAEPISAVVAAADIPKGDVVDEGAIGLLEVPRRFLQPGSFSRIADVAGRIASVPIRKGSQVTEDMARPVGGSDSVAALVPFGKRAVTVVLENAFSLLEPNDIVDVIAAFDLQGEDGERRIALTLAENIQVLAVGGRLGEADSLHAHTKPDVFFGGRIPMSYMRGKLEVVLAASPSDAQKIVFAMNSGDISLAVRPHSESDEGAVHPTTISSITGGYDELKPRGKDYREYRGRRP